MTKRYHNHMKFSSLKRRQVEANFEGGEITSDGGILLLRELDHKLGLTKAIDRAIVDPRHPSYCRHSQLTLLRQRIFGLALGYEDLNDHTHLRQDGAVQTAAGQLAELGSASTLCRMENRTTKVSAVALHNVLVEQFIGSYAKPPKKLVLDFDATHDFVHGEQQGRYFNAYYDGYCFLPLYVFCGKHLLASYLRPSSRGAAYHAGAVLKLLVSRLRSVWPKVKIVFRADAGFCTPLILSWCDRHSVDYVVGISKNAVLTEKSFSTRYLSEQLYQLKQENQKHFSEFHYQARSWQHTRRVVVKAEYNASGENTRYVVTSLSDDAEKLYCKIYCYRGDMENCIKEQKALFSDRTSCHEWWPNQFRVLLCGFAYVLMEALRRIALKDTDMENCQVDTLRLKLFKIGGVIIRNTRRIRILLSSSYPYQATFTHALSAINSS